MPPPIGPCVGTTDKVCGDGYEKYEIEKDAVLICHFFIVTTSSTVHGIPHCCCMAPGRLLGINLSVVPSMRELLTTCTDVSEDTGMS